MPGSYPGWGTRFTPKCWATSRSGSGGPQNNGPENGAARNFSSRGCQVFGGAPQTVENRGHSLRHRRLARVPQSCRVIDQLQVTPERSPSTIPSRAESSRRRSSIGQSQCDSSRPAAAAARSAATGVTRSGRRSALRLDVRDALLDRGARTGLVDAPRSPPRPDSDRWRCRSPAAPLRRGSPRF